MSSGERATSRIGGSRLRRICGALIALWFVALIIEPPAMRACAAHDLVGSAAGAAAHHAAPAGDHDHAPPSHRSSCVGDCCVTAPAALVPVRYALAGIAVVAAWRSSPTPAVSPAIGLAPHALPFANAPPGAIRA